MSPQIFSRRAAVGILVVGLAGCLSDEDDPDGASAANKSNGEREGDDESGQSAGNEGADGDERTESPTDSESETGDGSEADQNSYPDELLHPLPELLEAEDPASYAEGRIEWDDDRDAALVSVKTKGDRAVPEEYVAVLGSEGTRRISATVKPDQLRPLAEHENVTEVEPVLVPDPEDS